mmetsp:Transcript_6023/g.11290  ORF Transcript_6023/g.11290 Transcript_6023/m.11290 type:complete len:220 (+) Transcript_6023:1629-2288(+)
MSGSPPTAKSVLRLEMTVARSSVTPMRSNSFCLRWKAESSNLFKSLGRQCVMAVALCRSSCASFRPSSSKPHVRAFSRCVFHVSKMSAQVRVSLPAYQNFSVTYRTKRSVTFSQLNSTAPDMVLSFMLFCLRSSSFSASFMRNKSWILIVVAISSSSLRSSSSLSAIAETILELAATENRFFFLAARGAGAAICLSSISSPSSEMGVTFFERPIQRFEE